MKSYLPVDTPTRTPLYALEQALKAYRRLCQYNLDRVGDNLTVDQALVLIVLDQYPELSQLQIADLVFKDKASLTRIVELLVQKQLLTRTVRSTDRRQFDLRLTPLGQQTLAGLGDTIQLNQRTALAGLSDNELAQFHSTLQKIIANCILPPSCA